MNECMLIHPDTLEGIKTGIKPHFEIAENPHSLCGLIGNLNAGMAVYVSEHVSKTTAEIYPTQEAVLKRIADLNGTSIFEIDWTVFDSYPFDEVSCRCGAVFHTHTKCDMQTLKLISRIPCPACGQNNNIRGSRSVGESVTIR